MKKAADKTDTILGLAIQGNHVNFRKKLRSVGFLSAGKPILKIPQKKYRIPCIQTLRLGLGSDMQPAVTLDNQMKAGARCPGSTGMPATTVTADMK
ncbi:hypothetical protein PMm318_A42430 [Pseudomonas moorei]